MKILLTGGSSRLANAIVTELGKEHQLRLIDSVPVAVPASVEFIQGSILDPDICSNAVQGVDAVIHTAELPHDLPVMGLEREQFLLDLTTRGTHVLFKAGVQAGIKKFLYAGTLTVFDAYPDDVYISELWKPLPSSQINQMAKYLGEFTAREFTRDHRITVTGLRLGELVLEDEVKKEPANPTWLDLRDAAHAFQCVLNRDNSQSIRWTGRWAIYHICADIPNPKFLIDQAARIGYTPKHNFETHYQQVHC